AVGRGGPLAGGAAAHHEAPLDESLEVEGVQRLAALEHHVVGRVDHRVEGPHAGAPKAEPHPEGRGHDVDAAHDARAVARAEVGGLHAHAHLAHRGGARLARAGARMAEARAGGGPPGPRHTGPGPAAGGGRGAASRPATMRRSSWPTSSMASIFKPAMVSRSASAAAGPLQVTNSASQESGMRMAGCSERELPEEAESVVVEGAEVGEAGAP